MAITQVLHTHNLHHQARPPSKMLRPLPVTGLGIILLPRKPRALPFLKDVVDEILTERCVNLGGASAMRTWLFGNHLCILAVYA